MHIFLGRETPRPRSVSYTDPSPAVSLHEILLDSGRFEPLSATEPARVKMGAGMLLDRWTLESQKTDTKGVCSQTTPQHLAQRIRGRTSPRAQHNAQGHLEVTNGSLPKAAADLREQAADNLCEQAAYPTGCDVHDERFSLVLFILGLYHDCSGTAAPCNPNPDQAREFTSSQVRNPAARIFISYSGCDCKASSSCVDGFVVGFNLS